MRASPRLGPAPGRLSRMGDSRGKHARTHPPTSPPGRSQTTQGAGPRPRRPCPCLSALRSGPQPLRTLGPGSVLRVSVAPRPYLAAEAEAGAAQPGAARASRGEHRAGGRPSRVGPRAGGSARTGRGAGCAERSRRIRSRRGGGEDRLPRPGAQRSRPARRRTRARRAEPRLPHPQARRGPARPRAVPEALTRERCARSWKADPRAPVRCTERSLPSLCGRCRPRTDGSAPGQSEQVLTDHGE